MMKGFMRRVAEDDALQCLTNTRSCTPGAEQVFLSRGLDLALSSSMQVFSFESLPQQTDGGPINNELGKTPIVFVP